jgi:ATP-binding cassette subfamily B protein/subfamily B ATP-binding cassette protein MsbA
MQYALAEDLFVSLLRLSLRYHSARKSAELVRRVTTDSSCVSRLAVSVVCAALASLATLIVMFAIMCS